MEGMRRKIFSLAECYTLLAIAAASLLVYALTAGQARVVERTANVFGWTEDHRFQLSQLVENVQAGFFTLRLRMHNTWFFFVVFFAVWAAVLLWFAIEKWRNRLKDGTREFVWIAGITLAIFFLAVLYGIGTNGLLARYFPYSVAISDVVAMGFILALPIFIWFKLERQEDEDIDTIPRRPNLSYQSAHGVLGLGELGSSARLVEVKPEKPSSWMEPTPVIPPQANNTIPKVNEEMSTLTTIGNALNHDVSLERNTTTATVDLPRTETVRTVSGFREHMRALNSGWANIEKIGLDIEKWFDQQRHKALLHLETHPGMRQAEPPLALSRDFLNEKLAAVDAEWATIRKAALEICEWFGDIPKTDR